MGMRALLNLLPNKNEVSVPYTYRVKGETDMDQLRDLLVNDLQDLLHAEMQ